MKKVLILGSGNGSNFEAIARYFKGKQVKLVCVSDIENSCILKRAKRMCIENYFIPFEYTAEFLNNNDFDLCVLAGYMRILPENIINYGTFINIHPSLLPKYKGLRAIERAFENKEIQTGVTIHYVDKEVDSGEIITQEEVLIKKGMSLEALESKVHEVEHHIYPKVIENIISLC